MIKLVTEIPKLNVESAAYTKICCGAAAYAPYQKIALFGVQTDENECVTAIASLIDNVMTLFNNGADLFELGEFIKYISPNGIFTDSTTANALNLKIETPCDVLIIRPPYSTENAAEDAELSLDYAVDTVASRLNIGVRDVFKADLSHRIRHDSATFVTTEHSAGFVLYSGNFAIISGIAVSMASEKSGVGSATLKAILKKIGNRALLVCAEDKNVPFYLKNGFTILERCAYCRI